MASRQPLSSVGNCLTNLWTPESVKKHRRNALVEDDVEMECPPTVCVEDNEHDLQRGEPCIVLASQEGFYYFSLDLDLLTNMVIHILAGIENIRISETSQRASRQEPRSIFKSRAARFFDVEVGEFNSNRFKQTNISLFDPSSGSPLPPESLLTM